jgi:GNAT superfamily N-acetyltransferase
MAECERVSKQVRKEILGEGNEENTWYLHMLAVLPEHQGKGIAKKLVQYVTDIVWTFKEAIDDSLIEMVLDVI